MNWQVVDTIPIAIGVSISSSRAEAIRRALLRRAVPVSRVVDGRLEPLATGSLVNHGGELGLLTAAHIFEHASVGDLAVPFPGDADLARLRAGSARVLVDEELDLALVMIGDRALGRLLLANWTPVSLDEAGPADVPDGELYGMAGYPTAQSRRMGGCLFAKPLVVFTAPLAADRYVYAHTAQRVDGLEIHTPELEGVSGAMIWRVDQHEPEPGCTLRAVAVQVAFHHGRYVRAEPVDGARRLFCQA